MAETEGPARPQRWQRREERLRSERRRIKKHGAAVRRVYPAAVLKRLKRRP
jgi:hypothetical protein